MKKPERITDPVVRWVVAQTVQNFIDDPYYLWKGGCTDEEFANLAAYLESHGIPVPDIPDDERTESARKAVYLVWAALECNNCICALVGYKE